MEHETLTTTTSLSVDENDTPTTTTSPDATIVVTTAATVVLPAVVESSFERKRKVQFGTVIINEHPIIIGCNPAVSSGVPMSIAWERVSQRIMSIQDYETIRAPYRVDDHSMLLKDSTDRFYIFQNLGYSYKEIRDAEKAADLIRKYRQESIEDYEYDNYHHDMDQRDDDNDEGYYQRRLRMAQGRALLSRSDSSTRSSGMFSTKSFHQISTSTKNLIPRRFRERSLFRVRPVTG